MDAERMQVQWISAIWIFYSQQGHLEIPQAKAIQSACSPPIFPLMYFSLPLKSVTYPSATSSLSKAVLRQSTTWQKMFLSATPLPVYTPISKTTASLACLISHNRKCCAEPFLFHRSCVYHPFSFNQLGWQREVSPKEGPVAFGDEYPPLTQENKSEILSFSHSAKIKSNKIKAKKNPNQYKQENNNNWCLTMSLKYWSNFKRWSSKSKGESFRIRWRTFVSYQIFVHSFTLLLLFKWEN